MILASAQLIEDTIIQKQMMSKPEGIIKTTFILFMKNVVANRCNWHIVMPLKTTRSTLNLS